jgi:tryptophan synthase beta chain
MKAGYMEAVDLKQSETFKAGLLFAKEEGIIPAPESFHAIAAAIAEAEKCKETGEEKVILFNLSGHGLIDMAAYTQYLAGNLFDLEVSDEEVTRNVKELEQII